MYAHGNQVPQMVRVATVVAIPAPAPALVVMETPPAPVAEPLFLPAAPMFTYAPEYGMYAAIGVPYDLLYDGRMYYYLNNGFWFASPYYSGPWNYIPREAYLPIFHTFQVARFHEFREREYHLYEHDREHYHGRTHHPEFREHEAIRHAEVEHRREVAHREEVRHKEQRVAQAQKPAAPGKAPAAKAAAPAKKAPVKNSDKEKAKEKVEEKK
jgi:hypothetical protein